jgi:hypothetical protein
MSEPLSNVNTPLSYKLGIYRKEAHDPRLCIPEDWKGYNKCVRDLDQLSPDVHVLAQRIKSYCTNTLQVDFSSYGAEKLSEEIINKMNVWIVKKG